MNRQKTMIDELVTLFLEFNGLFWQVSAVLTVFLSIVTAQSLMWIIAVQNQAISAGSGLDVIGKFSNMFYVFPFVTAIVSLRFAMQTYNVYATQNSEQSKIINIDQ